MRATSTYLKHNLTDEKASCFSEAEKTEERSRY